MLQKVRDSLKGTLVASVVFLLFIVPLVLTGVGDGSYLGSAAGNDAASVEGKKITNAELNRAIYLRKQRLLSQQGVDADAEFLKDENLRQPVLDNLTRRAALIVAAEKGGMGIAEATLDQTIRDQAEFQVDGKFDSQTYRRLLNNLAYTPASYKKVLAEDLLLNQQNKAIELSAFSTQSELDDLVSLIQQKRSFFTVSIPKKLVEDSVSVSDEEVASFYEENKDGYIDEEKMIVNYIALSVDDLAKDIEIAEEDIKKQYDQEVAAFEKTEEYEIAHLLIETKDKQQETIDEVKAKLDAGEEFSKLVAEYSDDSGSKDSGGSLGVLTPGIFPEAFENAVYELEEGAISAPVETDAGTHFIKLVSKNVIEPPKYEVRKDAIASTLKRAEAEKIFLENYDRLGELSFSAPDLKEAAKSLGLDVKTTEQFTRLSGNGIASNAAVRDMAFSEEVLVNDYNSAVIDISSSQAVVVHKASHTPERIKDLDEVKEQIVSELRSKKIDEQLAGLSAAAVAAIEAGSSPEEVAKQSDYEYKSYDKVQRSGTDAPFEVVNKAFSMSAPEKLALETVSNREGDQVVVGLTSVSAGKPNDMNDQQFSGLKTQLVMQTAGLESGVYESQIVKESDIDIN